jgi:hypothetical protein
MSSTTGSVKTLDLSNYCPSDLNLKRIYLRRTATSYTSRVLAAPWVWSLV